MSFILDALKKNQAEQSDQPGGISLAPATAEQGWPKWLGITLGIALLLNVLLFSWYLLKPTTELTPQNSLTATQIQRPEPAPLDRAPRIEVQPEEKLVAHENANPTSVPASTQTQGLHSTASKTSPAVTSTDIQPDMRPDTRSLGATYGNTATNRQNSATQDLPIRTPTTLKPTPTTSTATAEPIATTSTPSEQSKESNMPTKRVKYAYLSNTEQQIFDKLNITSHIFTDVPDECAVVINGQRLFAGDSVEGLLIFAITQDGIVFSEEYQGKIRHVEFSVLDRWAS